MVSLLADLSTSFILGLLTPITALCVLPLYPGFLAYLSNQISGDEPKKKLLILFGEFGEKHGNSKASWNYVPDCRGGNYHTDILELSA